MLVPSATTAHTSRQLSQRPLLHQHDYQQLAIQYDGTYTCIPLVSCPVRPPLQPLIRRSTKWYHQHERNVHSLFRYEKSDADKLPAVGLPGGLCSITFSHRLFIDKFYALQNGPPNSSQQILTLTILRNDLMPSKTLFRPTPAPTSPFLPQRMTTQPTVIMILAGWKHVPVPASAVARAKSGTHPKS